MKPQAASLYGWYWLCSLASFIRWSLIPLGAPLVRRRAGGGVTSFIAPNSCSSSARHEGVDDVVMLLRPFPLRPMGAAGHDVFPRARDDLGQPIGRIDSVQRILVRP